MSEGRNIAILIGNSEFPQVPSLSALRCPQRDVEGLAAALTAQDIGLFDETLTFINHAHHTVLRAINRVFTQAGRHDQILIYYSGHGKQDSSGSLHLATADTEGDALETTSIAVDSFRRLIDNYSCKKVALILDCCFGGAAGKDFLKGSASVNDQFQQVSAGRGIYILTASTATQTAREKEGDEYSLLTKHILHGLTRGEADQDGDGLVSMDDLYEYVRARVSSEAPQHPMKWALGVQGGEFVIARAVKIYSSEQLRAFREMIKNLDSYLPDDVFDQAFQVIRANRPKQDKEFLSLLELLSENRLSVGEFVSRWLKLGLPFSVQQREPPAQSAPAASTKGARAPFESLTSPILIEETIKVIDWIVEEIFQRKNWRSMLILIDVVLFLAFNPFQWPFPNLLTPFPQLLSYGWYRPVFWSIIAIIFICAVILTARAEVKPSEK